MPSENLSSNPHNMLSETYQWEQSWSNGVVLVMNSANSVIIIPVVVSSSFNELFLPLT